jgi:protein-S-isoprenylcysteine O-methyltransferase Ste14
MERNLLLIGVMLAVALALLIFWQMSENGRYHPVLVDAGNRFLLVIDTRTGAWSVEHFRYQDLDAARKRRERQP